MDSDPGSAGDAGRFDVAVIGRGLAGLAAAWYLAESGVDRLCIVGPARSRANAGGPASMREASGEGASSSEAAAAVSLAATLAVGAPEAMSDARPELAVGGLLDHPSRVADALGEESARAIWAYAQSGVAALAELAAAAEAGGPARATDPTEATGPTAAAPAAAGTATSEVDATARRDPIADLRGALLLATFPVEAAEIRASAPLLERWGIEAALVDAPLDGARGRPRGLAALRLARAGVVDLARLRARLAAALAARGVRFIDGEVQDLAATIDAEVHVLACGPGAALLHPALERALLPIRVQGFRAPLPAGAPPPLALPVSASWGHEGYLVRGGAFHARGMRPDSQAEDVGFAAAPAAPTEVFQGFLRRFARERVPALAEALDRHAPTGCAGMIALPADGLPLLGPLPGTDRVLACAGLGFRGASLAAAAGRSVARLLAGAGADYPPPLAARRLA